MCLGRASGGWGCSVHSSEASWLLVVFVTDPDQDLLRGLIFCASDEVPELTLPMNLSKDIARVLCDWKHAD